MLISGILFYYAFFEFVKYRVALTVFNCIMTGVYCLYIWGLTLAIKGKLKDEKLKKKWGWFQVTMYPSKSLTARTNPIWLKIIQNTRIKNSSQRNNVPAAELPLPRCTDKPFLYNFPPLSIINLKVALCACLLHKPFPNLSIFFSLFLWLTGQRLTHQTHSRPEHLKSFFQNLIPNNAHLMAKRVMIVFVCSLKLCLIGCEQKIEKGIVKKSIKCLSL